MNYERTLKALKPIEMLKPLPLDTRSYFESYNEALEFANNSSVAYEGEIVSVKMENKQIAVYSLKKNTDEFGGNFVLTPVGDHVSFKYVDELPDTDIEDIIYILNSTGIGYVYVYSDIDADSWRPIIYPKSTAINEDAPSDDKLVTEKSVKDYVIKKLDGASSDNDSRYVTNLTYNKDDGNLKVVKSKSEGTVLLEGVSHNPSYDPNTRTFTFPIFGQESPLVVTLGRDIFIDPTKDNKYNPDTGNIELYLNDGTVITIPAINLVDVYDGSETDTIKTSVSVDNKIYANIRISGKSNNALRIIPLSDIAPAEYGLYVENKDYQPAIDEALSSANKYADQLKGETDININKLSSDIQGGDRSTLTEAKAYADTLIKNFAFITQNTLRLTYTTTEEQDMFNLPEGVTYNPLADGVDFYINGIKQPQTSFAKTSENLITLFYPLPEGYDVEFIITKLSATQEETK